MTNKTAFFPGGRGLWSCPGSSLKPDTIVLGQDFSTWEQHQEILHGSSEDLKTPTWRNLIAVLNRVGLDLERCFFTNAFMGLRRNGLSTGVFPGFRDAAYMAENADFLQFQIETIGPRCRGAGDWADFNFQTVDSEDRALLRGVEFGNLRTNLVALVHPSMRFKNVGMRRFGGKFGDDAEVSLLSEGLRVSGITRSLNGPVA